MPRGRTTLVTGYSGTGKTLFGVEFVVRGVLEYDEPGVLVTFEESAGDLAADVASLEFDLAQLHADRRLAIVDHRLDPAEFTEAGAFDLEGLFIRLATAIDSVGARRVVLDTVDGLIGAFANEAIVRAELGRLFRWLKDRGVTTVATAEPGPNRLTRYGVEEYVSDCVIVLDHRVHEELSTRRLRIVKYRGSLHGSNEYPFLITQRGMVVLPITALGLTYGAPEEQISTGVARLDHMLGGGMYRGSATLVSGDAGTGKTTVAARMVEAACERGERALFVSFDESPAQLVRDMRSVAIDLGRWVDAGVLRLWADRPVSVGLETHLAMLLDLVEDPAPSIVILDPLSALGRIGDPTQVISTFARQIDLFKARGITSVVTSLTHDGSESEAAAAISSLMDNSLVLRNFESNGERNRLAFVLKARGLANSNQVREFLLTDHGVELVDVNVGPEGFLTGSARSAQEAEERAAATRRHDEIARRRRVLTRRSAEIEAQIAALRAALEAETAEFEALAAEHEHREITLTEDRAMQARQRRADPTAARPGEEQRP